MAPIITLTTDFGKEEPYVAAMKGVILSLNPAAVIVDLAHEVPSHNVQQGAFIFGSAYQYFPPGTIHVVVVDPGVGSRRRAIAVEGSGGFFVAPDNGVLSYVFQEGKEEPRRGAPFQSRNRTLHQGMRAVELTEPRFWHQPVSSTFHGRDVFVPVAAHLSLGTPLEELGRPITRVVSLSLPQPHRFANGSIRGQVAHVDRFGNLITNIPKSMLPTGAILVEIQGRKIHGLSRSYSEGAGLLAIISSGDTLEIAVPTRSAAKLLKAEIGTTVSVKPTRQTKN